jgi:hypothetical protein
VLAISIDIVTSLVVPDPEIVTILTFFLLVGTSVLVSVCLRDAPEPVTVTTGLGTCLFLRNRPVEPVLFIVYPLGKLTVWGVDTSTAKLCVQFGAVPTKAPASIVVFVAFV